MKISGGSYIFTIKLLPALVFLLLLSLTVSLGYWQLNRADEKTQFLELRALRAKAKPLLLSANSAEMLNEMDYRPVLVRGKYDNQHQFLIDNQIVNGKVGFFVMTPFIIEKSNKAVLVNRGWVAAYSSRSILPNIEFLAKQTELSGHINHFPSIGLKLAGAEIPTEGWPAVVQVAETQALVKRLGYPLFGFQLLLNENQADGYHRQWRQLAIMPPEKHIAYAVQWFGLAITLIILFLWLAGEKQQ